MNDLNTPYKVMHGYYNNDKICCMSVVDCNGVHVFDCYECDTEELLKRINGYGEIKMENEALKHDIDIYVKACSELLNESPQQSLNEIRADAIEDKRLDSPAKVGAGTFEKGVKWRLVVEAAQRQCEYAEQCRNSEDE